MAQTPLVLQLQELATDNSTDITELLRKALLVATKLGLQPFRNWVNRELNGYDAEEVPEYRYVQAELKARNPYHGLIPFLIDDPEKMKLLCNVPIVSSIGSLAGLLEDRPADDSYLFIPFPPEQKIALMRIQDSYAQMEPVRTVGRNQVAAILDAVRTAILDWSLQLEADGVLGEGMVFSATEKQRAQSSITIKNFQGIIGDVSGNAVMHNLQLTVRQGDFGSLRAYLTQNGVAAEDIDDLERAIDADPTPTSREALGEKVSAWVGKMVSKAATGAWQVGVGAAGGFLGNALAAYYGL